MRFIRTFAAAAILLAASTLGIAHAQAEVASCSQLVSQCQSDCFKCGFTNQCPRTCADKVHYDPYKKAKFFIWGEFGAGAACATNRTRHEQVREQCK
jgi:hypothetical protein